MDDFSESFSPEEANKIVTALKKLKNDAMDGVTDSAKAAATAMDGVGDEAEELRRKTDAATESINDQNEALRESEAFENKIKQFLGLSGAAQVMRAALRDAMHTITELDATMTEMAVVTDLTVGDYWN
jgi:ABC-type transporter Mla subunit MlaD